MVLLFPACSPPEPWLASLKGVNNSTYFAGWLGAFTSAVHIECCTRHLAPRKPHPWRGHYYYCFRSGVRQTSCQGPGNKHFWLFGVGPLGHRYSTLSLQSQSHRPKANEWSWLCSSKNLLTKTGSRMDMAHGLQTPTWSGRYSEFGHQNTDWFYLFHFRFMVYTSSFEGILESLSVFHTVISEDMYMRTFWNELFEKSSA